VVATVRVATPPLPRPFDGIQVVRNRTPQTQEKRRREHDKQRERHEKIAKRNERNAAKREAKKAATGGPPVLFPAQDMVEGEPVPAPSRPEKE
jgi:hypothetical protein